MVDKNTLTHVDEYGKARMVDVSGKTRVRRTARAEGFIRLMPETVRAIQQNTVAKGDVLATARLAGIMAAKRTAELIPLCHNIEIEYVQVEAELVPVDPENSETAKAPAARCGVKLTSVCVCTDKTGIEMEALTAVSVAALTVYDMCKAIDKTMVIETIHLIEKTKEARYE
mgnify:CR=1 FL=1